MKFFLISIGLLLFSVQMYAQVLENKPATEKKKIDNINSNYFVEFAPSISADGKTMIFESDRNKGWRLFETKLGENGNWSKPVSISSINDFGRKNDLIAGPNISYDGNYLYFFGFFMLRSESEDIFVSVRDADGWSEPQPLGEPINTSAYEGFPSVSSDGKTLFFIRVNENNPVSGDTGEPCFEIWRSTRMDNNKWGEPEKLPAPINLGCERSPKILADGKTLLFSSIREGGRGLYDMYQTTFQDNGTWSDPVSLDFVNTEENDLSPCIAASGDVMYYYSNKDIYQVSIPPKYRQYKNITMEGYVKDEAYRDPVATTVIIKNKSNGEEISRIENNFSDGWYSLVLTKGIHYEIEFVSAGYISVTHSFDLTELEEYREEHVNVKLHNVVNLVGSVIDSELLTPEKANITVRDSEGQIVDDFSSTKSFNVYLNLKNDCYVSIAAENYEPLVDTIQMNSITNAEIEKVYKMIPKKVKVVLDVVDIGNNNKVRSKLIFRNRDKNETIEANSDEFVSLRSGSRYEVESASDGYFFGTAEIVVDELVAGPDGVFRAKEPILVIPIAVNASLVLKGIRFDTNSADLTEDSQAELRRIIQLMKDNSRIVVEISAHTDDVGDAAYNLKLSEKRAQSVVDFLLTHEVNKENLVPVGYGKSRPAVPNDSDENRAKNRRVEMSILAIK